jgi:ferric-dicitrate binding protein FerR (iron transport regulator)
MKSCEEFEVLLNAWMDDEISDFDRNRLRQHLEGCTACMATFTQMERVKNDCLALAACAERIASESKRPKKMPAIMGQWRAAAAILVVATLAWSLRPQRDAVHHAADTQPIVQAEPPRRVIQLADASDVVLNHPSHEMAVEFESKHADVKIVWLYAPVPEAVNSPTSAPQS